MVIFSFSEYSSRGNRGEVFLTALKRQLPGRLTCWKESEAGNMIREGALKVYM